MIDLNRQTIPLYKRLDDKNSNLIKNVNNEKTIIQQMQNYLADTKIIKEPYISIDPEKNKK